MDLGVTAVSGATPGSGVSSPTGGARGNWVPQSLIVAEVVELLKLGSSPAAATQKRVVEGCEALKRGSDGVRYLAIILARPESEAPTDIRQTAGLLLKSIVAQAPSRPVETGESYDQAALDFVKTTVLRALYDANLVIRRTAGTLITTIATKYGCDAYPEALTTMSTLVQQSTDLDSALAALDAWRKIAEDELESRQWEQLSPSQIEASSFVQVSNQQFIPILLRLCTMDVNVALKEAALEILQIYNNRHVFAYGEFGARYFDEFWNVLGQVAVVKSNPRIQLAVVSAMNVVNEYKVDAIIASAKAVFDFMVESCNSESYDVRLAAVGFWPEIIKDSTAQPIVESYLPSLIPILVEHTIYTQVDYQQVDQAQLEDDNASVPDEASAVAPRFYQSRRMGGEDGGDEDEEEDEASGGGVRSAWGDTWTVRKGAAFALDSLAVAFKGKILPHCLNRIEERLQSPKWDIRESGVLALGAISKGCMRELDRYVPGVLRLLIALSADMKPLLRSISCWCLNRFSPWICAQFVKYSGENYLQPVVEALLTRMLDRNKCVQEAACSSMAGLEENAKSLIVPYLPQIFETFGKALATYQAKNLLILYDAIGTLASSVGPALIDAHPRHHSQILLEPLFRRWQEKNHLDYQTTALCDCIGQVTPALGPEIASMAPVLAEKAVFLMNLQIEKNVKAAETGEHMQFDVIESCLDNMSFLAETLNEQFVAVVQQHNFIPVLVRCCADPTISNYMPLKQSAFALIGDLAIHCTSLLRPHLQDIIPSLARGLTASLWPVCSNASWALGQLVEQFGAEVMDQYAEYVALQLKSIVMHEFGNIALRQNACITLGRFALACPDRIASVLPEVLTPWCRIMSRYQTEREKTKSFKGICMALSRCPPVAVQNLTALLQCTASFYKDDLVQVPLPPGSQDRSTWRPIDLDPQTEAVLRELVQWLRLQCTEEIWAGNFQNLSSTDQRLVTNLVAA